MGLYSNNGSFYHIMNVGIVFRQVFNPWEKFGKQN